MHQLIKLLSCPHKNAMPIKSEILLINSGITKEIRTTWYCPDCGCQWREVPIIKESGVSYGELD